MITSTRPLYLTLAASLGLAVGLSGCASTAGNAPATAAQPVPMYSAPVATAAQAAETTRDDALVLQVRSALAGSPSLGSAKPVVIVYQRGVYLSGVVRTAADKEQATRLARTVPGITEVTNNLTVKTAATEENDLAEDAKITRLVKDAFLADPAIKALDPTVSTFKRVVYLSGNAATAADRDRADRLARTIPGVVDVTNNLGTKS